MEQTNSLKTKFNKNIFEYPNYYLYICIKKQSTMVTNYKISGAGRRLLKKELSALKHFVKNFWYFHQLDKDMISIFNCNSQNIMSDDEVFRKYN